MFSLRSFCSEEAKNHARFGKTSLQKENQNEIKQRSRI